MIEQVRVIDLWRKNRDRAWIQYLERVYDLGYGRDFETIEYWLREFRAGATSTLVVDRNYSVTDGHHRLIAANFAELKFIDVNRCPQRSTYG